jgi:hypothetical protein
MMMIRMFKWPSVVALAMLGCLVGGSAQATTLGFYCVSNSDPGNCAIGELQLSVDITSVGPSQVEFTFFNSGPDPSTITDVYFDDGSLLGIAVLTNMVGVEFVTPAIPSNLPGGNMASPPFVTTSGFSADAVPPPASTGVDPGEQLGITFDLQGGQTIADVLLELQNGDLRIGVFVQSIQGTGGSESFINNPLVLPEPGTGLLVGFGLTWLGIRRRHL